MSTIHASAVLIGARAMLIRGPAAAGKSRLAFAAIEAGYQRSFPTVLDANATTLITGLILFWFGTGPIKGFAATLCIGILTTFFSNVIIAHVITSYIYQNKKVTALSI